MLRVICIVTGIALGGCFSPDFSNTQCGADQACPANTSCSDFRNLCIVERTLSQTTSQEVMSGNSGACVDPETGFHGASRYFRFFDLAASGIDRGFFVAYVHVGIQEAIANPNGNPIQSAEVRLHTLTGNPQLSNLTELMAVEVLVGNRGGETDERVREVFVGAEVPGGSVLAVEFSHPDGRFDGNRLVIGSNNLGQMADSYIVAEACGFDDITPIINLGVEGMHTVLSVTGEARP